MQSLQTATNDRAAPQRCAAELLEGIPALMRCIRREMRAHRRASLSVPQFRTLVFASVHEFASISALAEHLGISLPAASRAADLLVRRGLLARRQAAHDRRHIRLSPTRRGRAAFRAAHRATLAILTRRLEVLTLEECVVVRRALAILGSVFGVIRLSSPRSGARRAMVGDSV